MFASVRSVILGARLGLIDSSAHDPYTEQTGDEMFSLSQI
jgi:hypothetical protein